MQVTVAICTWNRAALLDQTLARLAEVAAPPDVSWELIVVNNNCTDDTDSVLERHAGRLPLRRLFEPSPGLCHARNAAIGAARGELLVWTDDDVLVEPDWLAAYVAAARQWPQASFFGGSVEPLYAETPPRWLANHFDQVAGAYAVRRLGPDDRPLADHEFPFGANMAQRTEVVRQFLFDQAFGLEGDGQVRGDEVDLAERLRARGHRGVWVGTARVRHYIPAERLTARYLWNYYEGQGRSQVRRGDVASCVELFGLPRWAMRRYVEQRALSLVLSPLKNAAWLRAYRSAAALRGVLNEWPSRASAASRVAEAIATEPRELAEASS